MSELFSIRPATAADSGVIQNIAVDTGLFSQEELPPFAEILASVVGGELEGHQWLVLATADGEVIASAYVGPEAFADRVWNLFFLGVTPAHQKANAGRQLVAHVEQLLQEQGADVARVLVVETSGVPAFESTRRFYENAGFTEEARVREYYGPGNAKVIFWKLLVDE